MPRPGDVATRELATDYQQYLSGHGESPGHWYGAGATTMGLPDAAAQEHLVARMAAAGLEPAPQHPYWQANGGVTYRDPDGREVVFVSWVYGVDRTEHD
jgi:hypothetical protein